MEGHRPDDSFLRVLLSKIQKWLNRLTAFVKDGFPLRHDRSLHFVGNDEGHNFIRIGVEKDLDLAQVIFHRSTVKEALRKL